MPMPILRGSKSTECGPQPSSKRCQSNRKGYANIKPVVTVVNQSEKAFSFKPRSIPHFIAHNRRGGVLVDKERTTH